MVLNFLESGGQKASQARLWKTAAYKGQTKIKVYTFLCQMMQMAYDADENQQTNAVSQYRSIKLDYIRLHQYAAKCKVRSIDGCVLPVVMGENNGRASCKQIREAAWGWRGWALQCLLIESDCQVQRAMKRASIFLSTPNRSALPPSPSLVCFSSSSCFDTGRSLLVLWLPLSWRSVPFLAARLPCPAGHTCTGSVERQRTPCYRYAIMAWQPDLAEH